MKITAPFTRTEMEQLRSATGLPACRDKNNAMHNSPNRPPWRTPGELMLTQAGLICAVCGYTLLSVTIKETPT